MNFWIILLSIIIIITSIIIIYLICYNNLKKYKDKMDRAEQIIDESLNEKIETIISINTIIKKSTDKKDYLKDYISLGSLIITNMDKDIKLDEAIGLINNIAYDYEKINNDKDFQKEYKRLKEIDEQLTSAKVLYNQNAFLSNKLMKSFPYTIISKFTKFKIRSFYNTNKTDNEETF